MGRKFSPSELELYQRTDEVLHYVWDPIGVSDAPEARDEYHAYLPQVFSLLQKNAEASEISAYLAKVENEEIEIGTSSKKRLEVAELLVHWRGVIRERNP